MLKRWLGMQGENRAKRVLLSQGLALVARNYRCRQGGIDLVMRDGDNLVFIEVWYRSASDFGDAAARVDTHKQRRLIAAAHHYLVKLGGAAPPCRFDVVAIDGAATPQWVQNAFDDMP